MRIPNEIKNDYVALIERLGDLYMDCEHCYNSASVSCVDCKTKLLISKYEKERNLILDFVSENLGGIDNVEEKNHRRMTVKRILHVVEV